MVASPTADPCLSLVFDDRNRLAVRTDAEKIAPALPGGAGAEIDALFPRHTPPVEYYRIATGGGSRRVCFSQTTSPAPAGVEFLSVEQLAGLRPRLSEELAAALDGIDPFLIEIPYLHLGESDYIYRFRVERERNRAIYQMDDAARTLYQSTLCEAIKDLARTNERSATRPALLDFGAVRYLIPSHFGFCLGVKNAIERAYETLAAHPGRRVFMLSELIHNSFVNEDLLRRGLRFLQTDKGVPFTTDGRPAALGGGEPLLRDTLGSDDIVIIPAFGATDEDKQRLVRKGLRVAQYDATCMLVEKVWKAARVFGRDGYTVVIHGKREHEETKATFSNSRRYAHSIVIRNLDEARVLGDYILAPTAEKRARLLDRFAVCSTPGFDPARHLDRIAVVNQTTLLMNETVGIIDYFKSVYAAKHGAAEGPRHIGGADKRDTLCYATQVNQNALGRALAEPLDAAFVIGGKNSSNTYQLYRLCEQKLGARAFFIQSEQNIRSRDAVEHFVFASAGHGHGGYTEIRPLWPGCRAPKTVLITGGASCPDGVVQQVIVRINALFPPENLRTIDEVAAEVRAGGAT